MKRIFDIVVSLLGLVVTSPLLLAVALAIEFRTMVPDPSGRGRLLRQ